MDFALTQNQTRHFSQSVSLIQILNMNLINRATLVSFLSAFFFATCLAFGKGHNVGSMLLLLVALFFAKDWFKSLPSLAVAFCLSFAVYYLIYVLNMLLFDGSLSDTDQASRFLLVIPIFLLMLHSPLNTKWLLLGIVIGSSIAGLSGAIQLFVLDIDRGFLGDNSNPWLKGYMPIQTGNMAMSLAALSLCCAVYWLRTNKILAMVAAAGAALGIFASIYSSSRGGWAVLPITLIFLFAYHYRSLSLRSRGITLLASIILLVGVSSTEQVQTRINHTLENIQSYTQNDKFTSVGLRIEIWKSALLTFQKHPVLGAGEKERQVLHKQWGEMGLIDEKVAMEFRSHSHNQYLDDLSVRGAIGFITLMGIFLVPLYILWHGKVVNKEAELTRQLGTINIVAFMIYNLSQCMFSHNSGTIFYALSTAIIVAAHLQFNRGGTMKNSRQHQPQEYT